MIRQRLLIGFYFFLSLWILSCSKKDSGQAPVAAYSLVPQSGLTTDTFSFSASTSDPGSVAVKGYYRWDWEGDGIWDTEYDKNPLVRHRYYVPGTHKTVLEVINSDGLTDTLSRFVEIGRGFSPPHPHFVIDPPEGNFRTSFLFDARVSYDDEDSLDQLQFRWDWDGDGSWDTRYKAEPQIYKSFRDPGEYTIGLQVLDPDGRNSKVYQHLLVHNWNPDLIPNFTWTPEYGTTADTFLLDASSSFYQNIPFATLFYSWKLPPDYQWTEWDTCPRTRAIFGRETDYSLEMQVRDTNFLIAHTVKKITIYHQNLPPKPVFEVGCQRGNIRTQFFFDAWMTRDLESIPTQLLMRWDFNGDGNYDTEFLKDKTIYHQFPKAGTYKVVLEAKDPEGLSDTTSQYVIVSPFTNETGLIRDHRDQQMYGTVKIGDQWWMSENLNFAPWDPKKDYVNKLCYSRWGGDPVNWCDFLGGLYNIYHATRNDFYNDVEGICPSGWHIPARWEWEQLIESIGGWDAASKLVLGGETDFNARYSGFGHWKTFTGEDGPYQSLVTEGLGEITYFWSFKRLAGWPIAQSCWNIALLKDRDKIYSGYSGNTMFLSVRCVKDEN